MAIDTEKKRKSAAHVAEYGNPVTVLPDGTIDATDRQVIAWSYSGIAADAPVVGAIRTLALLGVGI